MIIESHDDEHSPPESDFSEGLTERVENIPTDERVYQTALELYEPTQVSEVADRADCSKNDARRHLKRLAEIGLLSRVMENPEAFKRNESFFEWRRYNRLSELSDSEYKNESANYSRKTSPTRNSTMLKSREKLTRSTMASMEIPSRCG